MAIDVNHWHHHALSNRLQTLLLLTVMGSFMLLLGYFLWGLHGVIMLTAMGLLLLLINPQIAPHFIMQMYNAVPLPQQQAPRIYAAIKELFLRAGLNTVPAIYYIPSSMINAFAVGRADNASIAVTDGLLRILNSDEIIGVLAHEISHIRNNDLGVMGLADMFTRVTSLLSLFGQFLLILNLPLLMLTTVSINWIVILILIFAPNISALAQLGLSRTREYNADLNAVMLTGNPTGLAHALMKIERVQGVWLERIFLPGRRIPEPSLLRTHPPTAERVKRLMALKIPESYAPIKLLLGNRGLDAFQQSRAIQRKPRWHLNGLWH